MNPGAGTNNISNNAGFSAYFAKYNTSGTYQYAYAIEVQLPRSIRVLMM
ncbi:MAG: hypothetical protein IPK03_01165 [Bacteroidetes bacterium]|nr:hypothetical protein [Bacteroidota bacterium]